MRLPRGCATTSIALTTRTDILDLLRRDALTVSQLCERLGITRNAVNVQLRLLEVHGLVRPSASRPRGAVGKPAVLYEAAPGSEDLSSKAYQVFLPGLLAVLKDRLDPAMLGEVLDELGRQLARAAGLGSPADFDSGLAAAMSAADALGASTEAVAQDGGLLVRNYSCPLGSAVRQEACVCRAMASFFSEATGREVSERCERGERLVCQYFVKAPPTPRARKR